MTEQLFYMFSLLLGDAINQIAWLLAAFVALAGAIKIIERGWLIEAKEQIETRLKQESNTNEVTLIDIGE